MWYCAFGVLFSDQSVVSDSLGFAPLSLPVGLSSRSKKESSSSAVAARAEEEEEGAAAAEDVGRERRGFQDRGASPPPVSSGVGFCRVGGKGDEGVVGVGREEGKLIKGFTTGLGKKEGKGRTHTQHKEVEV